MKVFRNDNFRAGQIVKENYVLALLLSFSIHGKKSMGTAVITFCYSSLTV